MNNAISGMLCRAALITTDISEERIASIIRIKRISKLETTLAITSNLLLRIVPSLLILFIMIMDAILSSETSVLARVTWPHIPEDGILHYL
jgi:hypothetical protein